MTTKLEKAREALEFAELSDHSFPPNELAGFYAGWAIAASGDLDLCQGVIDRMNEMLAAGEGRDAFAVSKIVGWAAYHRELIKYLAKGE